MGRIPLKPLTYERFQRWAAWSAGKYPTTEAALRRRMARKLCRHQDDGQQDSHNIAGDDHASVNQHETKAWIDSTIQNLKNCGLVDDSAAASAMVAAMRRKGMPRRAIIARLKQKGVDVAISNAYFGEDTDVTDTMSADLTAAQRYLQRRRLGPYRPQTSLTTDEEATEKALRALVRAGFDHQTAMTAVTTEPPEN